jgi:protein-L-isoaspartate(D-aspartate) O-methyltransferase (PCMT)
VPLETIYSGEAVITRRASDGIPISSSSMPEIMASMLQQLDVQPSHRVLEIGAGTGYNAALLAVLTGSDGEVTTIDIDEAIVREARERLNVAGHPGIAGSCVSAVLTRARRHSRPYTGGRSDSTNRTRPAWRFSKGFSRASRASRPLLPVLGDGPPACCSKNHARSPYRATMTGESTGGASWTCRESRASHL